MVQTPAALNQQSAINPTPQIAYPRGELQIPWREHTGRGSAWTQDYSFGPNLTRGAFLFQVPWAQFETAIWQLTGYSTTGGGGSIKRRLPFKHQNFKWLWAKSIQKCSGTGPIGTLPCNEDNSPITQYSNVVLTVEFWIPPYAVVADGLCKEWERYCEWTGEPSGEFMTRQFGQMAIREGTFIGKPFKGQKSLYIPKKRMHCRWHQVPEPGLFPNLQPGVGSFDSANLDGCVGKINSVAWGKFPPGTVLFEAYGYEPIHVPVDPTSLGVHKVLGVPRMWDVIVSLLHSDPPLDAGATTKGHNTVPTPNNLFALATSITGGNGTYQSTDLNQAWVLNA